jgi:KDO2-lipid IV(A) lauroyltransferase
LKHITYLISFFLAYIFYLPFKFLPYETCLSYGRGLVMLLYPIAKKHRKIAYENISYAFPELSEEDKLILLKKSFLHLGTLLAGSLWAPRLTKEWMDEYFVYDENSLRIDKTSFNLPPELGFGQCQVRLCEGKSS